MDNRDYPSTCQSRCTADDFLNVVGNSTVEGRVGGIADMGQGDETRTLLCHVT
jgi:hypothetical protein